MGASSHEVKTPVSYNIQDVEKAAIEKAIRKHNGNLSQAAQELGMGRSTLYRKMKKYGL
jgi:transcriptional regulator of acetoin/glycerol metabolism